MSLDKDKLIVWLFKYGKKIDFHTGNVINIVVFAEKGIPIA